MKPLKTQSRTTVYEPNRFLCVEMHSIELPDGRVIEDWAWVKVPEYATILARTTEGKFLCFRQVKYAIPVPHLAPPGGLLDPGEDPLAAAKRELQEETGFVSDEWHALGSYVVDSNRGCGKAHLFLALKAREVGGKTDGDLEEQELLHITREDLELAMDKGEIPVLNFAALLGIGLRRLDQVLKDDSVIRKHSA
jgi:ADP-ribose pyrophosphatase